MPTAKKILITAATAALALGMSSLPGALAQDDPAPGAEKANGAEESAKPEKKKKKKRGGCVFRRSISGFSVIDRNHFVLRAGSRDFLVTLSPGCHNMNFETTIAIKSTPAAGMCVERGDRVILDHGFTCFIRDIEWVESRDAAKKLVKERTEAEKEDEEKDDGDGE